MNHQELSLHNGHQLNGRPKRILVLGEVLWDVFEQSARLGGAPLNFAAHLKRLGCDPLLISAVGNDELGDRTAQSMEKLGLDTRFVQKTGEFQTGTAQVHLGPGDQTRFAIARPAAYDSVSISAERLSLLQEWAPTWLYYGTLFSHLPHGKAVLDRLLGAFPPSLRFYDLNLRSGYYYAALVTELLGAADVVKLNEEELTAVHDFTGLPSRLESFCREASQRFGW
jgi:fructokinase